MRVFHRANGDILSVLFNTEGTLSTAYLTTTGDAIDVSHQLPGITEDIADQYLTRFGYSPVHTSFDRYKPWNEHFHKYGLYIDQVKGNLLFLAKEMERNTVFPFVEAMICLNPSGTYDIVSGDIPECAHDGVA